MKFKKGDRVKWCSHGGPPEGQSGKGTIHSGPFKVTGFIGAVNGVPQLDSWKVWLVKKDDGEISDIAECWLRKVEKKMMEVEV